MVPQASTKVPPWLTRYIERRDLRADGLDRTGNAGGIGGVDSHRGRVDTFLTQAPGRGFTLAEVARR